MELNNVCEYHYSPKSLKKKFKDMTQCFECGHLDAFESATGIDRVSCCASCGSTDISRKPTIELTQTWLTIEEWKKLYSAPTGGESVQNEEVPPVGSL